jgi:hypothetical protein
MEGDYDRGYACISDAETAKAKDRLEALSATQRTGDLKDATWETTFDFDNELYPSLVLSTGGRTLRVPNDPHFFGDPIGLARVVIRPTVPNAKVHVEVQVEGFAGVSALDVTLGAPGQQYAIAPLIRWNYSRLDTVNQSIPAIVTYKVTVNGTVGEETRPIRVRSVNDVPFEIDGANGKQNDLSFLFAGYVNESHPFVETLLQEALHYKAVDSFVGYQSGPDAVRLQVFSLWNVLQRRNMHYSSVTTASASSPSGKVHSQAVRFIDQSITSQQANCADGSVLFASLMYKIGIQPLLVVKPGHMFVGYYLDPDHKQFEFLETTKLGAGPQPSLLRNVAFSALLPARLSESYREFLEAVQFATNVYSQEVSPAIQEHRPHYVLIDIAKARQAGINAIPHREN